MFFFFEKVFIFHTAGKSTSKISPVTSDKSMFPCTTQGLFPLKGTVSRDFFTSDISKSPNSYPRSVLHMIYWFRIAKVVLPQGNHEWCTFPWIHLFYIITHARKHVKKKGIKVSLIPRDAPPPWGSDTTVQKGSQSQVDILTSE
jgi:hypothetical protein